MAAPVEQKTPARVASFLRLPPELREAVASEAMRRDRSLNQQITFILRDWLLTHGGKR